MEGRTILHYHIRQLTIQFPCVFLILSATLLADKPWLTKSVRDWDEKDVEQILSDSPWVEEEAVRIVHSEDRAYRESFFGLFGEADLYWVRFTWMAKPIQQACELIEDLPVELRANSPVLEFLTTYRAFENWQELSDQEPLLSGENIIVLLQGDILSGLIGPHNSQEVETAFLSTKTGKQIEARNALFGVKHSSYGEEEGVVGAVVKVEDLKGADQGRQSKIDQTPPSTIRYEDDLKGLHHVQCVVLIFPHEALGDEDVTVVVPMGGKIGLTPKFRLSTMFVAGRQEY